MLGSGDCICGLESPVTTATKEPDGRINHRGYQSPHKTQHLLQSQQNLGLGIR